MVGPHTQNFRDAISEGQENGFATTVGDADGLARAFESALEDPGACKAAGHNAREFALVNRGAASATVRAILPLLKKALPGGAAAP